MCTITIKEYNCPFFLPKRNIQHVRASFALFALVETGSLVGWRLNSLFVWACWTKHISNNILNWFFGRFENLGPSNKLQEKRVCSFFKSNIAHLTSGRALKTLIVAFVEKHNSLFLHAKYIRAHCIRTIHVPKKFNNTNVIPRNRSECATHRSFCQFFHTCLQRNIGTCRSGKFRNG